MDVEPNVHYIAYKSLKITHFQNDFVHIVDITKVCFCFGIVLIQMPDSSCCMTTLRDHSTERPTKFCNDFFIYNHILN